MPRQSTRHGRRAQNSTILMTTALSMMDIFLETAGERRAPVKAVRIQAIWRLAIIAIMFRIRTPRAGYSFTTTGGDSCWTAASTVWAIHFSIVVPDFSARDVA